jgi:hypothetical protein
VQKDNKEYRNNFDKLENNFYILQHDVNKIEEERLKNIKNEKNNINNNNNNNEFVEKFKYFENRAIKRLEFLEEKEKILDNEIIHLKKEFNLHYKNIDNSSKNIEIYRKEFEKIEYKINEISRDNKNKDELREIINDFNEKINVIENENQKKFEEITQKIEGYKTKNNISKIQEENEIDKESNNEIIDDKQIKDIQKRLLDIEKNFKSYISRVNIDNVKNDIRNLNDSLSYINTIFDKDIKSLLENISNK